MEIKNFRKEYLKGELKDEELEANPILQFNKWFKTAVNENIAEVNAVTLATATRTGRPSARTVLLKGFDEIGFVFYTNYTGRKAAEIESNPFAALLIFWKELERQIRIEGRVERVPGSDSDEYFNSRPLESKLSAIVSKQSQPIESRKQLEEIWVENLKKYDNKEIPRPDYWGGYRVIPDKIEFWQGRPNRMHDRILYSKTETGWKIERLQP
jgi:pyridoxamine 5'-phosphate oxidase